MQLQTVQLQAGLKRANPIKRSTSKTESVEVWLRGQYFHVLQSCQSTKILLQLLT